MKRFQSLFLVIAIILCGTVSWAQTGPALSPAGATEIDSIVKRAVEQNTVPGVVVAIANKDRVLYYKSFRLMDVAKQKPMTNDEQRESESALARQLYLGRHLQYAFLG